MAISLQPAHLKRYRDVAQLFMKYGRRDMIVSPDAPECADLHASSHAGHRDRPGPSDLADDIEAMGPTFIKIGQFISTRPDLLPPEYVQALARLQDKVEPFPFEEVERILKRELGTRYSKGFKHIDRQPLAAASLGQVHLATLRDGQRVAVKVQRPGIREQMTEDLDALSEVADILDHRTEVGRRYELKRLLREFRKTLLQELDYEQEAQNLITLHENLKEFRRIVVPLPFEEFTTPHVLTMEYIEGMKITSRTPPDWSDEDGLALAEELFRAYLKQVLVDGFFHADPHPGNALLTKDSSIALLDLGMVGRASPRMRDAMIQVLLAVSDGRGEDAATSMIEVSEKKEDFDGQAFTHAVEDQVARYQEATLRKIAAGRIVMDLCKTAAESGIRPPVEVTTVGKTLLNLDLLGKTLSPEFNPNESIRRNAAQIVQRRLTDSLTVSSIYSGMLDAKKFAWHLPGRVSNILDLIARNELKVEVDAIDETKLMEGFQKVANRIAVGLILAALIIGAAILTMVDSPNRFLGYPILSTLFFLGAAAGGVALLVRIIFYDDQTS